MVLRLILWRQPAEYYPSWPDVLAWCVGLVLGMNVIRARSTGGLLWKSTVGWYWQS